MADDLIGAIVHVMNEVFSCPVETINFRFTKYLLSVVIKIC
jgi:hypothetical protein